MSPIGINTNRSIQDKLIDNSKLWLLLVGVNKYGDEQIPSLSYSAIDCQGLAEALIDASRGQFTQNHVRVHHDFAVNLPILENIKSSLQEIINSAKKNDTVLFYFSGHGLIEANTQEAFLCLADTQIANLANTGLSLPDLLNSLNNCAAQNQLVWLDACHSGLMTLRGMSPTPQLVQILQQKAVISKGFYALLSCDTNQQSWEFPELGHGVFTYYLMRGLSGEAADINGVISADSLYRYVYYQTLQYIDKSNQQLRLVNQQKYSRGETQLKKEYPLQTPKRIVEGVGELIIGRKLNQVSTSMHRRVGLMIEGLSPNQTTLEISKILGSNGGFELEYFSALKATPEEVKTQIIRHINSPNLDTFLLYLRGKFEDTETWEGLRLGENIPIKRSWLKQQLRSCHAKQIIIFDCIVTTENLSSIREWLEDIQIDSQQGQCIILGNSPSAQSEKFSQAFLQILTAVSQPNGLSAAHIVSQLQLALADSKIPLQVSFFASQGILEILPPQAYLHKLEQTKGLDLHVCPYMGLNAFSESDSPYYFGRDRTIQELIYSLQNNSFLAVVGASGSGKSSLLQAGVIPQLRLGKQIPNSEKWLIKTIRPGNNPLAALEQKLLTANERLDAIDRGNPKKQYIPSLHLGIEGFVYWLRSQSQPMLVLIVDQFEELFTLTENIDRQKFLELLLGAVEYAGDRFKLIITLRADFIASCLEIPQLAEFLQRASLLVSPKLSLEDYRQVITKPADKVGLKVEPELVEVLLRELDNSVGNLPLLEFVLEQLWQHRINGALTLQAYQQQLGGIQGALERSSQSLYDSLEPELKDCAKWIFLALTQLGEGTEDTRRRVLKSELIVKKYPQELVDRTLQILTQSKLIVLNSEDTTPPVATSKDIAENSISLPLFPLTHSITVEVAHEILIRHWSTLKWWLEENREKLRKQRQIEQSTQNWLQSGEQSDFLLQGVRLAEAEDIYIKYTDELSQDVQRYIAACLSERKRLQIREKQRLRQAQRAVVGLSILGIAACSFGGLAYWQGREAKLREIEALNSSSRANLLSNQQLESLIIAVKAGKELQNTLAVPEQLKENTIDRIQQAFNNTQEINRLEGHKAIVSSISLSRDGKILASGSDDRTLKVWRSDGTQLLDIQGHNASVKSVKFRPDDKLIASASFDRTVKLWDSQTGKLIQTLGQHKAEVMSVAFTSDGKILASTTADGNIYLWSQDRKGEYTLQKSWKAHPGNTTTTAFAKNNQVLLSGSSDGEIKFWQVRDGKLLRQIPGNNFPIQRIAISPDGNILAVASSDRTIKLWHLYNGKLIRSIDNAHNSEIRSINFSFDGQTLVSASSDSTIKVWNFGDGELLETFQGHSIGVYDASFSPDDRNIISAGADRTIRIWQRQNILWKTLSPKNKKVYAIAFNPQGNILASGGEDRKIRLWNIPDGSLRQIYPEYSEKYQLGHLNYVLSLAFSPDGQTLASSGQDTWVKLWRVRDGYMIKTLLGSDREINSLSFSPNGKVLASAGADGQIWLWNLDSRTLIKTIPTQSEEILALKYSPNGNILASAGRDKTIKLWQTDSGKLIRTLVGHSNGVNGIAFSPDGKTIASASSDKTIKLWQTHSGKLIQTLEGHRDAVWTVNFDRQGDLIASGSSDLTIKIWTITGKEIGTLRGHKNSILDVSFAPDTKLLASASFDGTVKLWRLDSTKLRNFDLSSLLLRSCDRLQNYIQTNPTVPPQEQHLCSH
jgi:WD40 repeat protein/uncharacterized caspase-like protein